MTSPDYERTRSHGARTRGAAYPGTHAARVAAERGLYRPHAEHDACGIGLVAQVRGVKSRAIVDKALTALRRMSHRGGTGSDSRTGDGAGILVQIPHAFFVRAGLRFPLPAPGHYGVGMLFMPRSNDARQRCVEWVQRVAREEGLRILGWRAVPVCPDHCGGAARDSMPAFWQLFLGPASGAAADPTSLERSLYLTRRRVARGIRAQGLAQGEPFYICSLSTRTIVYKGMLTAGQLPEFYADLASLSFESALALVHSRFSTNTFPSWSRAHPYRFIAHNGEINTSRGNLFWMRARERALKSAAFGPRLKDVLPVIEAEVSDSGMFDNSLELLLHTGRSLPHAMMMMVPEAWHRDSSISETRRAFYEYHAHLMEPWDGPASVVFSDGVLVGALLDRNGLRPSHYVLSKQDVVVAASELGVVSVPPEDVVRKGRLQPGGMFVVDTAAGRILGDADVKETVAARHPYAAWLRDNQLRLEHLPCPPSSTRSLEQPDVLLRQQKMYGFTLEDTRRVMRPMAVDGQEPVGSMGSDTPIAALSERPRLLFDYFKQLFAQVTNPPIDPLREALVMSLRTHLGSQQNLFEETPQHCAQLVLDHPILTDQALARIEAARSGRLKSCRLSTLFPVAEGAEGLATSLERLCTSAGQAVRSGHRVLILSDRQHSDRQCSATHAPIPSLLAGAAVHHYLLRVGRRGGCGLIVDSGEPREVMHMCLLLGYGVNAVCPYLAYATLRAAAHNGTLGKVEEEQALGNYVRALCKGILKVMSKMGISSLQSYHGAQIFEALGINREVLDRYFTWTHASLEGIGLTEIAWEAATRHREAYGAGQAQAPGLHAGGDYQWRRGGEYHMYNPRTIGLLQHAVRSANYELFKKYSAQLNTNGKTPCTLRGLLGFTPGRSIPLDQVEPARDIVKRFKTGAMSFGSVSKEAHETLAIAMNRLGARSNTGEGGEDPVRNVPDANGDLRRSAIKQVASGRFGVTIDYLVQADEIQIKMAQGAKPGEGGQLPGRKVDAVIARLRHSTPGVGLISPPPHHDIYSIEDLAQLIYDLKNANPRARVSVKLVAEAGVGTVAAGVAKAGADCILISGDSGGTGAAPLSSVRHAGSPWELGLAEAQQTLVVNGLRGRVRLETDGQLKTGRDVAVACLLGAEEFGFGTAALVATGCVLMRVCHLNTCPVGVATQDPELRKRFAGQPEHVINFMLYVAEELREIMAELGFDRIDAMVGRADRLAFEAPPADCKAKGLDLSALLHCPEAPAGTPRHCTVERAQPLGEGLDRRLLELARPALEGQTRTQIELPIRNVDRAVCTMLSGEITRTRGREGLPPGILDLTFVGSAGQSFCAFLAPGVCVRLEGDANDYFGKGLSGGQVVVVPPRGSTFVPEDNVIVGNVALYGATTGQAFLNGRAGERFAVRNSGATAVVEGIGDHGCEYMTGGTVLVLGPTGRNFAAGMSGGIAYVLDMDGQFEQRCNQSMVELKGLDSDGEAAVLDLLRQHCELTGSGLARRVLDSFLHYSGCFVRVMPIEYKKALRSLRATRSSARTADLSDRPRASAPAPMA